MGAPNRGLCFKRISINLSEEMDDAVFALRSRKEYVRCSYAECVRILILEGAKAVTAYYQDNDGKS